MPSHGVAYTREERDHLLRALVLSGGRIVEAAQRLDVKPDTLRYMRKQYRDRYEELQRKHGHELETIAVAGLQSFIVRSEEVKTSALERIVDDLEEDQKARLKAHHAELNGETYDAPALRCRNPEAVLRSVAIAQGISVQKILELTNRPTQIIQHNSIAQTVARLRSLGGVVEGTAEFMPAPDTEPALLAQSVASNE